MAYENILPEIVTPKNVIWNSPDSMSLILEDNTLTPILLKGASNFLYSAIKLKESTSKEVYKKSIEIWRNLIDTCFRMRNEQVDGFSLNGSKMCYLVSRNNSLLDITDFKYEDSFLDFKEKLDNFKIDITKSDRFKKWYQESDNGIIKLFFYSNDADMINDGCVPVLLLEFNIKKSKYIVYTGILIIEDNSRFFLPAPTQMIDYDSYIDMVNGFDIESAMEIVKEKSEELYNDYKDFISAGSEISVREFMNVLKKTGCKLVLKDTTEIGEVENIDDEESNIVVQSFFNTFKFETGESAVDVINLSEIKKIFRYNKLTILDVLKIFSREYMNSSKTKVTIDILSKIVYSLYTKKSDKNESERIKNELLNK